MAKSDPESDPGPWKQLCACPALVLVARDICTHQGCPLPSGSRVCACCPLFFSLEARTGEGAPLPRLCMVRRWG